MMILFFSVWSLVFVIIVYSLFKWATYTYDFFERRNIEFVEPVPLLGNFKELIFQTKAVFDVVVQSYMKFKKHRFFGYFELRKPMLMVTCPKIIKQITIKDFENFIDHRQLVECDSLFGNSLIFLKDQKWKDMRETLNPVFRGSRLRSMFQWIEECSQNTCEYINLEMGTNATLEVNLKELFSRFTNDVIASCAFGIRVDSLSEKNNKFYLMSQKAMNFSGYRVMKYLILSNFSFISKIFQLRSIEKAYDNYFRDMVTDTINQRKIQGISRPDMIHLLIEAQNSALQAKKPVKSSQPAQELGDEHGEVFHHWTNDELVAQCFGFYIGGFETSSTTMCFILHELMENSDVQAKLIEEVDRVQKELNGSSLTYSKLKNMKYLDMVLSETLRKWPPVSITDRVCTKACEIGDEGGEHFEFNIGDAITIPIAGIHRDPDYYPNPDIFDPERFCNKNKQNIIPFTYIPFGVGPRHCIGSRFALMETKTIVYHLLTKFTIERSSKSCIPIVLRTTDGQIQPKNGFWVNFRPRYRT